MNEKLERRFYWLLCALALACIGFLGVTTVYSSDDYAYSLYFDDGILGYLPRMAEHYQTVNGRALVHIFAHGLLEFPGEVFALVCLGCVLVVIRLGLENCDISKTGRARAMGVYLLLFLAMPASILTQGVMWISAFCNYVIPCVMVCWLIHLVLGNGNPLGIVLLAALCGATTEQMGAVTLSVLLLLALWGLRVGRRNLPWMLASILSAGVGYGTIFLSPSTQGRLLRETKVTAPGSMLESLLTGFRRQTELLSVTSATALTVSLVFLAWGWCRRERRWVPVAAILGTGAVWVGTLGSGSAAVVGWALVYALLAAAGLELIWDRMEWPGVLLVAAVASACIMMPTESNRSRCFLPLYLFLCTAAALLTAKVAEGLQGRYTVAALSMLMIYSVVSCTPVMEGYWHNYQIDQINAAHAAQWQPGEPLLYCMDYDKRYTDSKPYDSGGAYEDYYLQTLELDSEDVTVCYYGTGYPEVWLEQTRLRFPAYRRNGMLYLPLRSVVETAGGTVTLENGKIRVTLGELDCQVDYVPESDTNVVWESGSTRFACSSNVAGFYLEERFFTEFLGLAAQHSADKDVIILHTP